MSELIENPAINRIPEPMACGKKYLIAPSTSCWEGAIIISGKKDIRLSSRPNHNINQLLLERAIKVPITNVEENKNSIGKEANIRIREDLNLSELD